MIAKIQFLRGYVMLPGCFYAVAKVFCIAVRVFVLYGVFLCDLMELLCCSWQTIVIVTCYVWLPGRHHVVSRVFCCYAVSTDL